MYAMGHASSATGGNLSRRRSDVDTGDYQFFKLIEIPFSPFQNEFGDGDDDDFDYAVAPRCNHGSSRQEYLRSYTFSRKQTMHEKIKCRLGRVKAAVWAVVACNYNNLPRRVRRLKEKLKGARTSSSIYGSQRSRPLLSSCFRVPM